MPNNPYEVRKIICISVLYLQSQIPLRGLRRLIGRSSRDFHASKTIHVECRWITLYMKKMEEGNSRWHEDFRKKNFVPLTCAALQCISKRHTNQSIDRNTSLKYQLRYHHVVTVQGARWRGAHVVSRRLSVHKTVVVSVGCLTRYRCPVD